MRLPLIVHERIGIWSRQLRPRVASWPVCLVETRPGDDIGPIACRSACPLVVVDLGGKLRNGLEAIDRASSAAPFGLILAMDPLSLPGLALVARELGAALVLSGAVAPPEVMTLLERWLPLAWKRAEADGWAEDRLPEPEPWESLLASSDR